MRKKRLEIVYPTPYFYNRWRRAMPTEDEDIVGGLALIECYEHTMARERALRHMSPTRSTPPHWDDVQ